MKSGRSGCQMDNREQGLVIDKAVKESGFTK